jgi:MerR family transcriptional regulator, light-induced transcriptional regulator
MRDSPSEGAYAQYLAALLDGDRAVCQAITDDLRASGVGLKDLYVRLFQRALYRVGELWEHNQVSVAVEHLATAITERLLTSVQAQVFSGQPREQSVIIACVADEYHQLGARMVADIAELRGWRGHFLGANTPLPDLRRLIEARRPTLVGLSLSIYSNLPALLRALDALEAAYPDLPVVVGGQAFGWGGSGALERYSNVSYVGSLDELEARMQAREQR